MIKKFCGVVLTPLALVFAAPVAASCGATFCTVNTDWNAQGASSGVGARLDLRYEFVDQDRSMASRDRVAVGEIPGHHDDVSTLKSQPRARI